MFSGRCSFYGRAGVGAGESLRRGGGSESESEKGASRAGIRSTSREVRNPGGGRRRGAGASEPEEICAGSPAAKSSSKVPSLRNRRQGAEGMGARRPRCGRRARRARQSARGRRQSRPILGGGGNWSEESGERTKRGVRGPGVPTRSSRGRPNNPSGLPDTTARAIRKGRVAVRQGEGGRWQVGRPVPRGVGDEVGAGSPRPAAGEERGGGWVVRGGLSGAGGPWRLIIARWRSHLTLILLLSYARAIRTILGNIPHIRPVAERVPS